MQFSFWQRDNKRLQACKATEAVSCIDHATNSLAGFFGEEYVAEYSRPGISQGCEDQGSCGNAKNVLTLSLCVDRAGFSQSFLATYGICAGSYSGRINGIVFG